MPDKIKLLYDAASKKYNVGTFEEFSNKLQDESKRKAFFDIASNDFDLGDFNSFTDKVKKKADSQPSSFAAPTGGFGLPIGSRTSQPTEEYTPIVLTESGKKDYKKQQAQELEQIRSQNIADKFKVPNTQLPKSKLGFKQPEVKTTTLDVAPQTKVYRDFNAPTIQQEFGITTPEIESNIGETITKQGGFKSDIAANLQKQEAKPTTIGEDLEYLLDAPKRGVATGLKGLVTLIEANARNPLRVSPLYWATKYIDEDLTKGIDGFFSSLSSKTQPYFDTARDIAGEALYIPTGTPLAPLVYEPKSVREYKKSRVEGDKSKGSVLSTFIGGALEYAGPAAVPGIGIFAHDAEVAREQLEQIQKANPNLKISDNGKDAWAIANGALGQLIFGQHGAAKLLNIEGLTGKLRDKVLKSLSLEALETAIKSGEKLTVGNINKYTSVAVDNFSKRLSLYGINAMNKVLSPVRDLTILEASKIAGERLVDAYRDNKGKTEEEKTAIFNNTLEEDLSRLGHAATTGAIFGAGGIGMGMLTGQTPSLIKRDIINNNIADAILASPEKGEAMKTKMSDELRNKGMSDDVIANAMADVDKAVRISSSIPRDFPTDSRTKAVEILFEIDDLKELKKANEQRIIQAPDELKSNYSNETDLINARIESKADELKALHLGQEVKFFEEDGKYYKQIGNGPKEEITETRYLVDNPQRIEDNAIQEQSTTGEISPTTEGGQNLQEGREGMGQGIERTEAPQEISPEEEVARLREQEQQELAKAIPNIEKYKVDGQVDKSLIKNARDLARYNKIYDKYDKLITPLLAEVPKEAVPQERAELVDVQSTTDFIRSNDLAGDISQRADQFFTAKEGKDINDSIAEEYHRAKLDGSNPALVKAVEESVPEVAVQETVVEAPQQGLRTVKLEVNEDLSNNGIGLRAVEMPDGKFGIFQEVDGKVTGKSLGRSFETVEELQSAYDGGIKDALTADAIRKAEQGAKRVTVTEVVQPTSEEQARLHNEQEGSTFTVDGVNRNGTKAASVSIFPERTKIVEGELTKEDIDTYVKENSDIYAGNGDVLAVGTWRNSKTGENYLDVSAVLPKKEATRLGKDYNQISVWDLEKGREIPTGGTGEAIEGLKAEIDRVSDIRNILGQQKGLKQAEVKPVTDSLQKAKDKLAAAKAKLDASKNNMGVAQDPKQRAKDLFEYHSSLVDVAKEYIKYGVKNVKDFAKELGEDVGGSVKAAWDEANGLSKKKMKDFIDATEAELIGITKKDVENLRENMGEEQFEYETQTREKLIERASKKIEDGANVPELIEKINNGTKKTIEDVDVEVIRQYYASLTAAINEAPTPELLAQRKALLDALDKAKVSAGRAVQAFDGLIAVEDNLSKFLADESKFADLTAEEITTLTQKYERIQEVHKELEERFAKLESEAAEKSAKDKIAAIRASERKAKVAAKKMDFKDERKVYVDEFRKRLREIRSGVQGTIFPYQRELVELAPFVAKMAKSYVSEGVFDLKTIVEGIHEQFKNDIEGLSPEDVRDIIAGKYVDTKQTKNAKLAQIRDLKSQARIEGEIEDLKNGIEKETKPVQKRKKSDRLVELEKELKEIKGRTREENAPSALDKKKTYYQNKIDKLKQELATGDFSEVKEPAKITLDNETLKLKDEYNQLVNETRERRDAKEREAMSKTDKALEVLEQVTGLKRLVQTALDLSIPLRQGVSVMLNPRTAKIGGESYVKMIKSVFNIDGKGLAKFKFDDKFYNRMMSEIERAPNYLESKEDGVVYTEIGSKIGERRDESHPSESFIYKIPYLSAPFKASERAAAGWTNSARFELYNRGVKQLLAEGKTRENSPKAYEDMAARVMVDTGRGKIPFISDKAPDATAKKIKWALGKTMYGARLFAASIRKLDPTYYLNGKVDKTVRVEAFKDMIGYTTSQILFHVAIASAIGATVSLDPDDSDFLKLRVGKKVIDLTAGQSAYIRTFLRLTKAVYLASDPNVSQQDSENYSKFAMGSVGTFFRNKLAPNTSYAVNAFMRTNTIGEKFDPYEVFKLYPMYTDDLITAFEDGSMLDAAIILPLAISGLGYQEYSRNVRQAKLSNYLDTKDSDLKAFLNKNKLTVSSDINQEIYNPSNGDLEAMNRTQSDKFESAWAKYVMQEVRDNIPAIDAMKADIFSKNPSSVTKLKLQEFSRKSENKDLTDIELKDKFYQVELKKKISTIKTDGNDYAKEVVIGFPKDLLKVEVNIDGKNVPHSLTKQEVDKRVVAYKKYIKENQETFILNYNQYISDGATPANAKKLATRDLKMDAVSSSGDEILDKYYDEVTGEFKF